MNAGIHAIDILRKSYEGCHQDSCWILSQKKIFFFLFKFLFENINIQNNNEIPISI